MAPTLATLASCSASPCVLGSTLSDTSTLIGTATQPGTNGGNTDYPSIEATDGAAAAGTITGPFRTGERRLYRHEGDVTVVGNRQRRRDGVRSDVYGRPVHDASERQRGLHFVATYSGDRRTQRAGSDHDLRQCTEREKVTVTGTASIASKQRWLPNDTVTLTGSTNLTGTLTITLYPTSDCTGTAVPGSRTPHPVERGVGDTFSTNNTTFFVGTNTQRHRGWCRR